MVFEIVYGAALCVAVYLVLCLSELILDTLCKLSPKFNRWVNGILGIETVYFRVPADEAENFKQRVLTYDFESDEHLLTYHKSMKNDAFRYFTFDSDCSDDITVVLSMLPQGSEISYG